MIDFSKGPIALRKGTIDDIRGMLATELPPNVQVTVKNGKPPQIRIRDGLWRGMSLFIAGGDGDPKLSGYLFRIPSFLAMVIIFVGSVAIFSIILMVVVSAVVGEFVPMLGGIGGLAGMAMYGIVEKVILKNVKGAWLPEIEQVIEKLKA